MSRWVYGKANVKNAGVFASEVAEEVASLYEDDVLADSARALRGADVGELPRVTWPSCCEFNEALKPLALLIVRDLLLWGVLSREKGLVNEKLRAVARYRVEQSAGLLLTLERFSIERDYMSDDEEIPSGLQVAELLLLRGESGGTPC